MVFLTDLFAHTSDIQRILIAVGVVALLVVIVKKLKGIFMWVAIVLIILVGFGGWSLTEVKGQTSQMGKAVLEKLETIGVIEDAASWINDLELKSGLEP